MKNFLLKLSFSLMLILCLSACQTQPQVTANISAQKPPEPQTTAKTELFSSPEMERYVNKTHGYAITLPKSWGTFPVFGGRFEDDLNDFMETIGPWTGYVDERIKYHFNIDILTFPENSRKPDEAWLESYIAFLDLQSSRTQFDKEIIPSSPDKTITDLIIYNSDGSYQRTHRMIEHKNKLYVFKYHKDNIAHRGIIDSIELF